MKRIRLTQNKFAIVDNDDYEWLNNFKWYPDKSPSGKVYVVRNSKNESGKHKKIRMHQEIMGTPKGMETDHIDGNGLNNQRKNLRICTKSQNQHNRNKYKCNTSGYKGVSWHKGKEKWSAQIRINGILVYLGDYIAKEAAYEAYCKACIKYHKEFNNIN